MQACFAEETSLTHESSDGSERLVWWCSGLRPVLRGRWVDDELVASAHASVPAAVALLLLDAGVMTRLIAGVAELRQHVRPQALVLGRDEAGQVVARLDLETQDG